MIGLLRQLRIFRAMFAMEVGEQAAYRGPLVIWTLWAVVSPTVSLAVWHGIAASAGGSVGGFAPADLTAYFLGTMLLQRVTNTYVLWEFDRRIREGDYSRLLLMPVHPLVEDLAEQLSFNLFSLLVMLPGVVVASVFLQPAWRVEPWALALLPLALAMAFGINLCIDSIVGMAAFWTTRTQALIGPYGAAFHILAGSLGPIALLPQWQQAGAAFLPFQWTVSFPVLLAIGRLSPQEALAGLAIQLGWLTAAGAAYRLLWGRAVRRYTAVGG